MFNEYLRNIIHVKRLSEEAKLEFKSKVDKRSINGKDQYGKTLLMYAAEYGRIDAAELLIECGADICARSNSGKTALIYAARNAHIDMVRLLTEAWFKRPQTKSLLRYINTVCGGVNTPRTAFSALCKGYVLGSTEPEKCLSVIELLLDAGADPKLDGGYWRGFKTGTSYEISSRAAWLESYIDSYPQRKAMQERREAETEQDCDVFER